MSDLQDRDDFMEDATDEMITFFEHLAIAGLRLQDIEPSTEKGTLATYVGTREDTYSLSRSIRKGARIDRRFISKDDDAYMALAAALSWLSARYGLPVITATQMKEVLEQQNKDDSLTWKVADVMRKHDQVLNEAAVVAKIIVETIVQYRAPGFSVRLGLVCFDAEELAYKVESNICGDGSPIGTIWLFVEDRDGPGGASWSPIIPFDRGTEFEEHQLWNQMQEELDRDLDEKL